MAATLIEDEEEIEEEESELMSSGCTCTICADDIKLTDEMFLLKVVHPFIVDGKLVYYDVLTPEGDYKYPPLAFDFSCWEDEEEEVKLLQEDSPPIQDASGVILCDVCESDICQGEAMGLVQIGEIRLSDRSPNNMLSASFFEIQEPQHLCIACLAHLEENQQDRLWPDEIEPVPNLEVCVEGLFERCWRTGLCSCPKRLCTS